jgi:hypothetical protein
MPALWRCSFRPLPPLPFYGSLATLKAASLWLLFRMSLWPPFRSVSPWLPFMLPLFDYPFLSALTRSSVMNDSN